MNPNDQVQQELDKVHQAVQAKQQRELTWADGTPVTCEQQKFDIIQAHNLQMLVIILLAALGVFLFVQWRKKRQNAGWN